jgi:type II secretory pathway predicted ATPase ExeA
LSLITVVLAGQSNLVDNLRYRNCLPLASRVVAKCHLKGSDQKTMEDYLRHHLAIAGVSRMLFDDAAVTAIHQGSGGLFRKANNLARGAIVAAARSESTAVTAEHVRLAATELF